ncbi:hypothetical protein TOPH_03548 [Tolypocladium ophioglossoides CBS 100239]|uniref:C2H2-type domain-containing protein n=1 Tax=Tolypocladium ophioglossoides (strain CBS 100239) TaxID=1163406 RepID=A0A0L0NEC7_TOLOC|nr:hypothetical protein TOPH_03548 [Tolypocladium ophioglossoides CBS 100239]
MLSSKGTAWKGNSALARAIADDAFLADFDSCDKVLNPGPMEDGGSDFVELKWKDKMMDEYIVPITYKAFLDTWNRVNFVAGTREKKRPYTMRVGIAGRLNDPSAINPRRKAFQASSAVAAKIAPQLTDEDPPAALPDRVVAYLTQRPFQDDDDGDDGQNDIQVKLEPDKVCGQPRCLFGCGDFANRSALTRHVRKIYMDIFKHPFPCLECKYLGWGECTIEANPGAWSNYIERKHGKLHAPNL